MKNITLKADADLIERARLRAARENRSLNAAIREWLQSYAGSETVRHEYAELMKCLGDVRNTQRFSREQLNER